MIYEPSPIATQARHYATQDSIMTAALPYDCGLTAFLLQIGFLLLAVRLPRFVMRQDVFLRLAVKNVDVVIRQVDWLYPVASRVHYLNPYGSSCPAARDQHRRQAYG